MTSTTTSALPPMDAPSQTDTFVRGASEVIGGPLGRHASGERGRYWVVFRVVVALTFFTLTLNWAQKSGCADGNWVKHKEYRHACYTDIVPLYSSEGLGNGEVPYLDHAVEYPVLTGVLMSVTGLPVYFYSRAHQDSNPYEMFFTINTIVLGAFAVGCAIALLRMRRRRPWDVAMFAVAPVLLLTATINWDMLAVGLAVFGLMFWAHRRPGAAGVMIALGASAKLWPAFLLIPILFLGLRTRRYYDALFAISVAVRVWLLVNLPFALLHWKNWLTFYSSSSKRSVDWGTFWYLGQHLDAVHMTFLKRHFDDIIGSTTGLNLMVGTLFAISVGLIGWLALAASRRPRLAQLAFLVVASFLLFSKVWSQQYVLWLLPLAVLARPRWGVFVAWQLAEICYFFGFDAEELGASGNKIMPEQIYLLASALRWIMVALMCVFVVRDVLRPERDAVRQTYDDDPDGGVFDGVADGYGSAALVSIR